MLTHFTPYKSLFQNTTLRNVSIHPSPKMRIYWAKYYCNNNGLFFIRFVMLPLNLRVHGKQPYHTKTLHTNTNARN